MILCKFSFILYVKTFASLQDSFSESSEEPGGVPRARRLIFDENHGLESNHCLWYFLPPKFGRNAGKLDVMIFEAEEASDSYSSYGSLRCSDRKSIA